MAILVYDLTGFSRDLGIVVETSFRLSRLPYCVKERLQSGHS